MLCYILILGDFLIQHETHSLSGDEYQENMDGHIYCDTYLYSPESLF